MRKYTVAEAAAIICGDNPTHKDPTRWLARQLRAGRFRSQKIGRYRYMTEKDIEAAEDSLYPSQPEVKPEPEPVGVVGGLSERGRRRLKSA